MGVSAPLPFLVYHDIVATPRRLYDIGVDEFAQHLESIQQHGWSTMSLETFLTCQSEGAEVPGKPLVLTFDDGYAAHGKKVFPLLAQKELAGTFFITVGFVGRKGYLAWDEIVQMAEGGMEIGSHGFSHRPLNIMNDADLQHELQDSRAILEEHVGHPIDSLSVPRGYYSRRIREFALQAGYRTVCTSRIAFNNLSSDPLNLGRIWVRGRRDLEAVLKGTISRFILQRFVQAGREVAKASLGHSLYNRIRRVLLASRAEEYTD